jgi:hypothetical protein
MMEENKEHDNSDSSDEEYKSYRPKSTPQKTPIGNMKYMGSGKVRSKDFPVTLFTVCMIAVPSFLYLFLM